MVVIQALNLRLLLRKRILRIGNFLLTLRKLERMFQFLSFGRISYRLFLLSYCRRQSFQFPNITTSISKSMVFMPKSLLSTIVNSVTKVSSLMEIMKRFCSFVNRAFCFSAYRLRLLFSRSPQQLRYFLLPLALLVPLMTIFTLLFLRRRSVA